MFLIATDGRRLSDTEKFSGGQRSAPGDRRADAARARRFPRYRRI
jgi:hypothetical protein